MILNFKHIKKIRKSSGFELVPYQAREFLSVYDLKRSSPAGDFQVDPGDFQAWLCDCPSGKCGSQIFVLPS